MDRVEFDSIADRYFEQHRNNVRLSGEAPAYFAEYKVRELKRICRSSSVCDKSILDFGSGIGNSTPFFEKYFPNSSLTSADVSKRCLKVAAERFPNCARFLLIKGHNIPARDQTFDVSFSACVFHHIAPKQQHNWLCELYRITRNGGLIALFEHNPLNPLTVMTVNTCAFDANAKLLHGSSLKKMLLEAGWRDPLIEYMIFFPRALAAFRAAERYLRWLPLGAQYVAYARKL